ncbi:hypothetical protein AAEX28_08090 [Lentisphaerota bacterium WC36G]|nr:hypothetical protein LJT99_10945 [Lentisphaerae bacterium WC36]
MNHDKLTECDSSLTVCLEAHLKQNKNKRICCIVVAIILMLVIIVLCGAARLHTAGQITRFALAMITINLFIWNILKAARMYKQREFELTDDIIDICCYEEDDFEE